MFLNILSKISLMAHNAFFFNVVFMPSSFLTD